MTCDKSITWFVRLSRNRHGHFQPLGVRSARPCFLCLRGCECVGARYRKLPRPDFHTKSGPGDYSGPGYEGKAKDCNLAYFDSRLVGTRLLNLGEKL